LNLPPRLKNEMSRAPVGTRLDFNPKIMRDRSDLVQTVQDFVEGNTWTRARLSWAQLLKRVFEIDMASCPRCSGPLTIIAAIEDPAVMAKILTHLGLPTRAPPRSPA